MSTFVFSVLCYLPPDLAPLGMQAVFIFQFVLDYIYLCSKNDNPHQNQSGCCYSNNSEYETIGEEGQSTVKYCSIFVENKTGKLVSIVLQLIGIVGLLVFLVVEGSMTRDSYLFPIIAMPLSIITLSFVWSNKVQEYLANPQGKSHNLVRYKTSELYQFIAVDLHVFCSYKGVKCIVIFLFFRFHQLSFKDIPLSLYCLCCVLWHPSRQRD